jgi:hypothetical protein
VDFASVLAATWLALTATAAPMAVPPILQANILKKALHYDRKLEGKLAATSKIFVFFAADPAQEGEIIQSIQKSGVGAQAAKSAQLAGPGVENVIAVYVMPGPDLEAVRKLCEQHQILSVSGDPALAESGAVSLALGVKADGKPQIVVNLKRVKQEGHDFNAQFLSLARLIQ